MLRFTHSGFECMTKVSLMGIPCGYVGLDKSHPYYGKHYDDIQDIEVHGGLTFSGNLHEMPGDLWWLGFDCGHAFDLSWGLQPPWGFPKFESNKSDQFVEEQTKRLAEQLEKIQLKPKPKTKAKRKRGG
jgi:hypothetical protein